jgi:hypothetical protein
MRVTRITDKDGKQGPATPAAASRQEVRPAAPSKPVGPGSEAQRPDVWADVLNEIVEGDKVDCPAPSTGDAPAENSRTR